ncbi:n/a [Ectocarpus siliculosus]|uniref:N/a n=1 Tax=Ectocarpus siliculosus TaxID=2880 RepID=D7FXN0_ECTSI|nr:n/a [Ectocarpus siliculosus]|eukprot:CBJ26471.1 n/a [Ectocarpus siliculosus]
MAEDAASMLSASGPLYTRLQLSISCKQLVNLDKLSKSDPFVVVKLHSPSDGNETKEIGRTEIITNSLDPKFVTIVPVTFKFEEVQTLRFEVYDVDTAYSSSDATLIDPSKQDFQGAAECALAQVVGGRDQTWEGLLSGAKRGKGGSPKVVVRAEEVANSNALAEITLAGSNLGNGSFLRISRLGEQGPPIPCFKTEVAKGSPPRPWAPIKISLQVLANGDPYRPLLIEAFSRKKSGNHALLGSCKASVNDLKSKADSGVQNLMLDKGEGAITVRSCILTPQPSFFDYIAGGMQIAFTVAVDYTASNGDPSQPGTLHYHDPTGRTNNEYGQAIQSVGGVLEYFDDDRRFPLFGFGGCPVYRAPASHCFAVNGNENDPEVEGIAGVLDLYRQSLTRVQLSGPTLFAPVISQAASLAASTMTKDPSQQYYTILLLITDGAICDMENTVEAIVAAADYPFSMVIVGVGTADYASMEQLDGDEVRLVNRAGQRAGRDIVQFVPMRDFAGKSSHALAKEVLAEIPAQVIEYMQNNHIPPGNPHRPSLAGRQGSIGSMALKESFMHNGAAPVPGLPQGGSFVNHQAPSAAPSFRGQPQQYNQSQQGSFMHPQAGAPTAPYAPPQQTGGDAPPVYSFN